MCISLYIIHIYIYTYVYCIHFHDRCTVGKSRTCHFDDFASIEGQRVYLSLGEGPITILVSHLPIPQNAT